MPPTKGIHLLIGGTNSELRVLESLWAPVLQLFEVVVGLLLLPMLVCARIPSFGGGLRVLASEVVCIEVWGFEGFTPVCVDFWE